MTVEAVLSAPRPRPRTVDVWFDPACPYTWLTARWLREAAQVRPLALRWHLMSLALLNEGRDDDPEEDPEGYLMVPVRIGTAVRHHYGQEALAGFHASLWADLHPLGSRAQAAGSGSTIRPWHSPTRACRESWRRPGSPPPTTESCGPRTRRP
ncbi:DsbA family protein [Streptomyces sp. SudanB182_2057]|uniref:DsbA family protein n=1 Tax=Streptomyces sp. SudanB182_2057 TaxID=3035281 RepID=UPI003F57C85D